MGNKTMQPEEELITAVKVINKSMTLINLVYTIQ